LEEETMKHSVCLSIAVAGALALSLSPAHADRKGSHHKEKEKAPPSCAELAERILEKRDVLAAASAVVPAEGSTPAYCRVDFTVPEAINIRVGLPLSVADGGSGGVRGAWNGKVQNLGGGGFVGAVGSVAGPVTSGFVGSSTDTGHSNAWCNAINPKTGIPNSLPNCGAGGAGFVLDPDLELHKSRVIDFITRSLYEQTTWALKLSTLYYSKSAQRNYWIGCSTGGRQGFEMAQKFGHLFDGFLVGAPAMNWNRFQTAEMWPSIAAKDLAGPEGVPPAKSAAANAAAIAACDANDGVVDGLVNEPRRCDFDANALLCTGSPSDPATCLTPQEANAVNSIWDGPRNLRGERIWGGLSKGTSFNILLPGGNQGSFLPLGYQTQWVHEDPAWDWREITMQTFPEEFEFQYRKFRHIAATDDPDLDRVRKNRGKIIHYHGLADPLIISYGSYNYAGRVFERYGVKKTQSFMRSFFYPGVGHCAGGAAPQPNTADLFDALQDWVENGVEPDHIVARQNLAGGAVRTRKVCKYPDEAVYVGTGSTDDEANFRCAVNRKVPRDLADDALTYKEQSGRRHRGHDHHGGKHKHDD
jgi:feruloyl esterase